MRVTVVLDHRFIQTPDGKIRSGMYPVSFWERYLTVFDRVRVVARIQKGTEREQAVPAVEDARIEFLPVPYYQGPREFCGCMGRVWKTVSVIARDEGAILLRAPSNIANLVAFACIRAKKQFAVEVVSDPWDLFSPGSVKNRLRPVFRRYFTHALRAMCRRASHVQYVTEHALQKRYPAKAPELMTGVSDVMLRPDSVLQSSRPANAFDIKRIRWVCVGNFNLLYKAQDVLVDAMVEVLRNRPDWTLCLVGDGIYLPIIKARVESHGIGRAIEFTGRLSGTDVINAVLDRSDVFVLPSRQEGLPRALVEAMARALPAVASNVGGNGELISADCLVLPNDVRGLARTMLSVGGSDAMLAKYSAQNLVRAKDFDQDKLRPVFENFLQAVRTGLRQTP